MKQKFNRQAVLAILAIATSYSTAFADIVVDSEVKEMEFVDTDVTVKGSGVLYLTSNEPIRNAKINIEGDGAGVIFEGLMCSEVKANYLDKITINGKAFNAESDRLSIYGNGSEIIPNGLIDPLTIYTEEKFGGESKVCVPDIYYRERKEKNSYLDQELLGDFNNAIRSFKLRRGYSATFANNYDGTGYSRVFTAHDEDIEVDVMPEGMEFVSFIRVCRVDRVGKRGICGLDITPTTRSSWYYSWGASDVRTDDYEFIPMRHNKWWDGWDKIGSREGVGNVLGYNEPDHTDQSDLSPDYAISEWPQFMKSGLRVGSPAPDAIRKDWLIKFLATADSLNYRVDFVATHMYWNNQTPEGLRDQINQLCLNTYGGRPMWITEWNNGANWTNEWWPDQKGTKLDAEFNPILDENGNTQEVSRPHTEANSAIQAEWLGKMLKAFDDCKWLERHSFYNWVEDARSVVIDGKLTPAGKVFAEHRSVPAFNKEREYVHLWRIAPPMPEIKEYNSYAELSFVDHNGETGVSYTIERRHNAGQWEEYAVKTLADGDYKVGKTVKIRLNFDEPGKYKFRVKAKSYKGEESIYSRIITYIAEQAGVNGVETATTFKAYNRGNALVIEANNNAEYALYSADGRLVRTITVEADTETIVNDLEKGVYIINGKKVMI